MKYPLKYAVRYTRAPGESVDTAVPVIVDRNQPTELAAVIENAIDRGLIAGLKPSAAQGIAEGVAEQLARELTLGRGIQFGQFFYGRPYLSGTVETNGRLSANNSINVRLYKGNAFKLSLSDFALNFEGSGDAPKIDFLVNADNGKRGEVVRGASVKLNGRYLYAAGDTVKVHFKQEGLDEIVVTTFSAVSDELLVFTCPDVGVTIDVPAEVWVERIDSNSVSRTTDKKSVAVLPSPIPAPTLTAGYTEGHENNPGVIFTDGAWIQSGTNLTGGTWTAEYVDAGGETHTLEIDHEAVTTNAEGTSAMIAPAALAQAVTDNVPGGTVYVCVSTGGGSARFMAEAGE